VERECAKEVVDSEPDEKKDTEGVMMDTSKSLDSLNQMRLTRFSCLLPRYKLQIYHDALEAYKCRDVV
jgi:hypothetical protein